MSRNLRPTTPPPPISALSVTTPVLVPQDRVPDRPVVDGYEVVEYLGAGGMGSVWEAVQLSTKRRVALKLLRRTHFGSTDRFERFAMEVQLSAQLEHPNIARVYDSGLMRARYYYAMQLIRGVRLDQFVQAHQPDERRILGLIQEVCRAVAFAHQRGILHRDVKPSNILVTGSGHPYLLDFGLATTRDEILTRDDKDYEVSGTLAYMSPEQARGSVKEVTARSDIYSIGVVLYQLLYGRLPHDVSGCVPEVLERIANDAVCVPAQCGHHFSFDLRAILLKCLERNPLRRYDSAEALRSDINRYLNNAPVSARKPTPTYVCGKWVSRHRLSVLLTMVIFAAFLSLLSYSFVRVHRERNVALRALYISQLTLARRAIQEGNVSESQRILSQKSTEGLRGWEWRYLVSASDSSLATIGTRGGPVISAARAPQGEAILSVGYEPIVHWWDLRTGHLLKSVPINGPLVGMAHLLPGGAELIGSTTNGVITAWHTDTGRVSRSFDGKSPQILAVACSPPPSGRIAALTDSGLVLVFDADTQQRLATVDPKQHAWAIAISPGGDRLVIAGSSISVWSIPDVRLIAERADFNAYALATDIDVRTGVIATGHADGSVRAWSQSGLQQVAVWDAHTDQVSAVLWHAETGNLMSASFDKTVCTLSPTQFSVKSRQCGHTAPIRSLVRGPSRSVLTYCDGGDIKVWGSQGPSGYHVFNQRQPVLAKLGTTGQGLRVLWIDADEGHVQETDVLSRRTITVHHHGKTVRLFACSSDLGIYAVVEESQYVTVFRREDQRTVTVTPGSHETIEKISLSADGSMLAIWTNDYRTHVFDTSQGRLLCSFASSGSVHFWLPEHLGIVTGDKDHGWRLVVRHPLTGRVKRILESDGSHVRSLAWDVHNERLIGGTESGTVCDWTFSGPGVADQMRVFPGTPIFNLAVSSDGMLLAVEGTDVQLLDRENHTILLKLRRDRSSRGTGLRFGHRDETLCLLSDEGVYYWWRTGDGDNLSLR